jgi:ribosomal protein S27E
MIFFNKKCPSGHKVIWFAMNCCGGQIDFYRAKSVWTCAHCGETVRLPLCAVGPRETVGPWIREAADALDIYLPEEPLHWEGGEAEFCRGYELREIGSRIAAVR